MLKVEKKVQPILGESSASPFSRQPFLGEQKAVDCREQWMLGEQCDVRLPLTWLYQWLKPLCLVVQILE